MIIRKQNEKAVQMNEGGFRFFYDNTPLMFFTVDENGTVLSTNEYAIEKLGYTIEEVVGQPNPAPV